MECCSLLVSPQLLQMWHDKAEAYGPIVAGGLCGAGWWFWVDAVACNAQKVPFVQVRKVDTDDVILKHTSARTVHPWHRRHRRHDHDQLRAQVRVCKQPATASTVAHRDDESYDPFDEGVYCRSRFWLFVSYLVSFGAIVGAVWVFLGAYATVPGVPSVWPGVAAIFQVCAQRWRPCWCRPHAHRCA